MYKKSVNMTPNNHMRSVCEVSYVGEDMPQQRYHTLFNDQPVKTCHSRGTIHCVTEHIWKQMDREIVTRSHI